MLERIKIFFECFFTWKVKPKGKLNGADVVGIFAFGFLKRSPGKSNRAMAKIAEKMYKLNQRLFVISQWEIADLLEYKIFPMESIREHRIKGKYLDTLEVATQMVEEMWKRDWKKKVIVIAHSLHVWRAVKVLQKLGVETIIPVRLKTIPFDPKSEQWYTRNWFFWVVREIPARLYHFLKGWI